MTPINIGHQVTVDGLPGRGIVSNREGRILTIKFRSGEVISRDERFVHSFNENTVNKMWNEHQHQLTAGGPGSGCRGDNCGRKALDSLPKAGNKGMVKAPFGTAPSNSKAIKLWWKDPDNYDEIQNKFANQSKVTTINIMDVKGDRGTVQKSRVMQILKNPQGNKSYGLYGNKKMYPLVVKYKNEMVLVDGHHRLTSEWAKGNTTAKVNLVTIHAVREWTELEEGKPIDRRPVEDGIVEQQGTLFCVKKGIENFGCYPTKEAAEERLHMRQSSVMAGRDIQHFGITKADRAILSQFDNTWKWGGRISKRAHLLARAGYLQRDGFKFKITAKGHDALSGKDDAHINAGGPGSGCHGENCGRRAAQVLENHGWQKTKEWEDGAIYRHPDYPTAKIAVNHTEGTWRSRDSEGIERDLHKHLANIHGGGPGSGRHKLVWECPNCGTGMYKSDVKKSPATANNCKECGTSRGDQGSKGLNKWKSRDAELKDAAKDPKQLKLPLKGSAPGTGWDYGQRHGVGFIPKRTLSGFPAGRGKGAGAPSNGTGARTPNPSLGRSTSAPGMRRPNTAMPAPKISMRPKMPTLKADDGGEPMAGNMSHVHIDPKVWFHPPSLKNADYVPGDDPGETDDKFGDVTKRNSNDTQEFRMKLLKRSSPGPMESVPVRTTLIAPNSGVYMPGQITGSGMLKQRPAKVIGAKRTHVSYNRRGCI